ncbi:MAG: TonB-dependent receptor, partial [Planctomycetia bacterium]
NNSPLLGSGLAGSPDFGGFGGNQDVPASYQKWDGMMGVGLDLSEKSRLEMTYLRTELNDVELPGVIYDLKQSVNQQYNVRYIIQDDPNSAEKALVQLWYTHTPYRGDSLNSSKQNTYYDDFVRIGGSQIFNPVTGQVDVDTGNLLLADPTSNTFVNGSLQTYGFRTLMSQGEEKETRLTLGADFRRTEMSYRERTITGTDTLAPQFPGGPLFPFPAGFPIVGAPAQTTGTPDPNGFVNAFAGVPTSRQDDLGTFTNVAIPVTCKLTASVGGRVDLVHSNVRDDLMVTDFTSSTEWLGMGYVTAKYEMTEKSSLNAGVGYGMRNAALAEMYNNRALTPVIRTGNSVVIGGDGLNPEKNLQVDFGVRRNGDRFSYAAGVYSSLIDDYILVARDPTLDTSGTPVGFPLAFNDQLGYRYRNLSRASLYGGDVSAEWKLLSFLALNGSLNYVKGTNHDPGNFGFDNNGNTVFNPLGGSDALPNIYPLTAQLGLRLFEAEAQKWSVEAYSRMTKGQDYLAETLEEFGTPGFTIFGLRGFWQATDKLRLTAAANNLFDRSYFEHGSLSVSTPDGNGTFVGAPGLNFIFGAELTYSDRSPDEWSESSERKCEM